MAELSAASCSPGCSRDIAHVTPRSHSCTALSAYNLHNRLTLLHWLRFDRRRLMQNARQACGLNCTTLRYHGASRAGADEFFGSLCLRGSANGTRLDGNHLEKFSRAGCNWTLDVPTAPGSVTRSRSHSGQKGQPPAALSGGLRHRANLASERPASLAPPSGAAPGPGDVTSVHGAPLCGRPSRAPACPAVAARSGPLPTFRYLLTAPPDGPGRPLPRGTCLGRPGGGGGRAPPEGLRTHRRHVCRHVHVVGLGQAPSQGVPNARGSHQRRRRAKYTAPS